MVDSDRISRNSGSHRVVSSESSSGKTTLSTTAVKTYFIITKSRQGGRVFRKMNGRWTRNRFHSLLAVYHSRATADVVALAENATVVEV